MVSKDPAPARHESTGAARTRTVVAIPLVDRLLILVGMPAVGLLLALLLPPSARWAINLSIALPVRPVLKFLSGVDQPWEIAVALAVGLALGLGVAFVSMTESPTVTVTDTELRFDRDDYTRTIPRADVAAVFQEGKKLVVLDRESRQLIRETHDARPAAMAGAFREHGYPWQDTDPYASLFRRWAPDIPDLPSAVNAVLAARQIALKKKAGTDIRDLRDAVANLGFVVREDGSQQYWRPLVRS